jgi:transposase
MHKPHLTDAERLKIEVLHREFRFSHRQIARRLKCNQSTVSRVLKQCINHIDLDQLHHHQHTKKFNSIQLKHLFNIIRHNKNSTSKELQRHFFHHDSILVSDRTIRRYRRMLFHPCLEILIPRLKLDHYLARSDYCMTHASNNFHTVVFSDEKSFCLDHTSSIVWIEDDDPIPLREISSAHTKVMVWGGIWYNGRTELGIVKGNIDHVKYIKILQQYLLPSMPTANQFLFQQDNAPPHQPINVLCALRDFGIKLLQDYPAHSPDFNPIEHVWSWMVQYVKKEMPIDRSSLINAIQRAWNDIPQKIIRAYIDNLPTLLEAVEKAGGARLD